MFWSDPNLYGVTLPYKDIHNQFQAPFAGSAYPWQNLPRFLPPNFVGFNQPYNYNYGVPMAFDPFARMINPMFQQQIPFAQQTPIMQQFPMTQHQIPFVQQTLPLTHSFVQPYNLNAPLFNYQRPFC